MTTFYSMYFRILDLKQSTFLSSVPSNVNNYLIPLRSEFPKLNVPLEKIYPLPKMFGNSSRFLFFPSIFCCVWYFLTSHPLSWKESVADSWPSPGWLWLYGHKLEPTRGKKIKQNSRSWSLLPQWGQFSKLYWVIYVANVYQTPCWALGIWWWIRCGPGL